MALFWERELTWSMHLAFLWQEWVEGLEHSLMSIQRPSPRRLICNRRYIDHYNLHPQNGKWSDNITKKLRRKWNYLTPWGHSHLYLPSANTQTSPFACEQESGSFTRHSRAAMKMNSLRVFTLYSCLLSLLPNVWSFCPFLPLSRNTFSSDRFTALSPPFSLSVSLSPSPSTSPFT